MTTTTSHHLGHAERRRLQAALGVAVVTIVLVVAFVAVGGHHPAPTGTVFERRVAAITDCDVLASEWSDHESAFRLTGNTDAQRRADIVHNHELAIGC